MLSVQAAVCQGTEQHCAVMLKVEDVLEEEVDVTEAAAAAADESMMQEMSEEVLQRDAPLLTTLSAQQIRLILDDVCTEMLSGLEVCVLS